jgi:hypothetical protein
VLAVPGFQNPFNCFREKADSIRRNTSVFIGSLIRSCPEKLIDQVSIRRMNLDAVESGFLCFASCPPIVGQGLFDPASRQGNRLRNLCHTRSNQRPLLARIAEGATGRALFGNKDEWEGRFGLHSYERIRRFDSTLAPVRGNESLEY